MLQADVFRLAGHYPAGGSANTMAHFFQNYNSGTELHFVIANPISFNLDFCFISYRGIIPVLRLRTSGKFGAVRNDVSTRVQSHPSDRARLFGSRRQ